MFILLLLSRFIPFFISAYIIFNTEAVFGGITLLILYVIKNVQNHGEELGRIEHKLDTIAFASISDETLTDNYSLLHSSAWDHEYPMKIDAELAGLAKKRNDYLTAIQLVLGFTWYVLLALWVYKLT